MYVKPRLEFPGLKVQPLLPIVTLKRAIDCAEYRGVPGGDDRIELAEDPGNSIGETPRLADR